MDELIQVSKCAYSFQDTHNLHNLGRRGYFSGLNMVYTPKYFIGSFFEAFSK